MKKITVLDQYDLCENLRHNQLLYLENLSGSSAYQNEVLDLLDKASDIEPAIEDKMPDIFLTK